MKRRIAPAVIIIVWLGMLLSGLNSVLAAESAWPLQISESLDSTSLPTPFPTARETTSITARDGLSTAFTADEYAQSLQPGPDFFWHKLEFQPQFTNDQPRRMYLVCNVDVLRHLDFYVFAGGELLYQQRSGLLDAPDPEDYSGIFIPLDLQNQQTITVLIRKQNDGPGILPLQLMSEQAFTLHQRHQFMWWGALIAVLLALGLYNALIYAMYPGPAYLWYLCFHGLTFFYFSGLHGYGFLIWPAEMQRYLAQHILSTNFILLWLVLQFARVFLSAARNAPWHNRFIHWFTPLCLGGAVIAHGLPEYQLIPVFSVLQAAVSLFCLTMAISAIKNQFRPAIFFLLSWISTAIGAAIGISTFVDLLPAHFFTLHSFVIGSVGELILLSIALADRIKFLEDKALSRAFIDPHTHAPNFSFFNNRFPEQLPELQRQHPHLFMLVLDLHGFRELVGWLGPDILRQAYDRHVERLVNFLRQEPWAVPIKVMQQPDAYFITLPGGLEMLLVDTGSPMDVSVKPIIRKLLELTDQAITVNDINSKIGFRIGCAPFRPEQHTIFECFRLAQVALLTAQREKRAFEIYSTEQDIFIKHRLSLLSDLRLAIAEEQLRIDIQPQLRIEDGHLIGGEVLVNWQHPLEGTISPAIFIPLAEQSQLVFDITRQVLDKTCAWLQQHEQKLPANFHLSVNLSALDINDNRLLPLVKSCITRYQVKPGHLFFEVTESAVLDDPERFVMVIQALHSMGFQIAIDDFGTGYSSMSYLQQLNADEIKIDIRFVRNIHRSATNQNIVKAIVQLARASGAHTVAEGIESDSELAILKALECDFGQGFLWSAPIPAELFASRYLALDSTMPEIDMQDDDIRWVRR